MCVGGWRGGGGGGGREGLIAGKSLEAVLLRRGRGGVRGRVREGQCESEHVMCDLNTYTESIGIRRREASDSLDNRGHIHRERKQRPG